MTDELANLAAFKACRGVRFWADSRAFELGSGRYATDNGAIFIDDVRGERECMLSINLVELTSTLAEDEFFVRLETKDGSPAPQALLDIGAFVETDRIVAQGFVERYAVVWRFARCRFHWPEAVQERLSVECPRCRESWKAGVAP